MPENEDVMALWLAVATQWRVGAMGVIGLDYAEVRRWAADMDVPLTAAMWAKIKTLEQAVLEAAHVENDRQGNKKPAAGRGRQNEGRKAGA